MVASETGAQQYKLFNHEFKALDPKEKKFTFEFQAHKGKALTKISTSTNAKDLLEMLNMSKKAIELMDETTFNFKLDSQFVLHISRIWAYYPLLQLRLTRLKMKRLGYHSR